MILKKQLEFHKYDSFSLYATSNQSCRGVAITIRNTLPCKLLNTVICLLLNYLLVKISLSDSVFIIGLVYGPTLSQDTNFMANLKRDILNLGSNDYLIRGDLNMLSDASKITDLNKF